MRIERSNIRDLPKPDFIDWLVAEDDVAIDDADVHCFKLDWAVHEDALDSWALHIRRHYIRDDELIAHANRRKLPIDEYLQDLIVPDAVRIRGGDFAEIVISDLLQFVGGYEVPRYKHHGRKDKNASEHGTDVIAYKIGDLETPSDGDELLAVEVKSRCSSTDLRGGIKEAATDSLKDAAKDNSRKAMTLEYFFRCSFDDGDEETANELERFLNAGEHPFISKNAVGVVAGIKNAERHLSGYGASDLFLKSGQSVFIVHGVKLMELVKKIYDRCVQ